MIKYKCRFCNINLTKNRKDLSIFTCTSCISDYKSGFGFQSKHTLCIESGSSWTELIIPEISAVVFKNGNYTDVRYYTKPSYLLTDSVKINIDINDVDLINKLKMCKAFQ